MKKLKAVKDWVMRYSHAFWFVAYLLFYLLGFMILENAGHRHYHIIHSVIDDQIPFCEWFIFPYYIWFAYIALGVCYFIFKNKNVTEFYRLATALAVGMTVFLVVSAVWPNAQDLRPTVFTRDNIAIRLVQKLYASDTPTNILPSIHVYNSLVMFYAINECDQLKKHRAVRISCGILTVSIILATMFLKQHSVVDVSMGILMSFAVQMFCDRVYGTQGESLGLS